MSTVGNSYSYSTVLYRRYTQNTETILRGAPEYRHVLGLSATMAESEFKAPMPALAGVTPE